MNPFVTGVVLPVLRALSYGFLVAAPKPQADVAREMGELFGHAFANAAEYIERREFDALMKEESAQPNETLL